MKYKYIPKNNLEKFGEKIYFLLVDNFPETFYVGGMVRDLLLKKTITDIDIATSAKPLEVSELLKQNNIPSELTYKNFGVVIAKKGSLKIEVATMRTDTYSDHRYPKVSFIRNPKKDSQRRDFTINALYLSLKNNQILDFQSGLKDLKEKRIKFIGNSKVRIQEDPLRIIRALRFALSLNFSLDKKTQASLKANLNLVNNLTKSRIENEIKKIKNQKDKNIISQIISGKKVLDILAK